MNPVYSMTLYKNAGEAVAWWSIDAVAGVDDGTAELVMTYARSADATPTIRRTPVVGKNIGKVNETNAIQQAEAEAISRITKQLDGGYVKTIEEAALPVTNGLGLKKPQLSTDIRTLSDEQQAEIDYSTAYLQPKLNGNRSLYSHMLYSRAGNEFKNLGHISDPLAAAADLNFLHLDGEIYKHDGTPLQKISGLIKKNQDGTETLQYWLYDVVDSAPFAMRYAMLQMAYADAIAKNPELEGILILTPTVKVNSWADVCIEHDKNIADNYEGSILRWGDDGYEDGKRTKKSLKLKPFEDHEYKVVDYKWGTPNRDKDDNELLVPIYTYEVSPGGPRGNVTAPGDMYEKDEQGRDIEAMMGKLMTITHMGYTVGGVPDIATAKCWYEPL